LALKKDIVVALDVKPGQFVSQGQTVARVWHATDSEEELRDFLRDRFILGRRRTPRQDAGCPIEELVEIAVRALSPGINDPFTAVTCVDRLVASALFSASMWPTSAEALTFSMLVIATMDQQTASKLRLRRKWGTAFMALQPPASAALFPCRERRAGLSLGATEAVFLPASAGDQARHSHGRHVFAILNV
jgi:hypothetical protein